MEVQEDDEDFEAFFDEVLNQTEKGEKILPNFNIDPNGSRKDNTENEWGNLNSVEQDDFLAWLEDDTRKFSKDVLEVSKYPEPSEISLNFVESTSCGGGDDGDLLTALSAELHENNINLEHIIRLCKRIGKVHTGLRGQVWGTLLRVYKVSTVMESIQVGGKINNNEDNVDEEENELLTALAEAALLRARYWGNVEEAPVDLKTNRFDIIRTLQRWAQKNAIKTSFCDPGLADVALILRSPSLKIDESEIHLYIDALQQRYILLLRASEGTHDKTDDILKQRAIILLKLVEVHDPDMFSVCKSVDFLVSLPFRWWRCAFAGEVRFNTLLELWDVLIIDSCPENSGDTGPVEVYANVGIFEGCDPRGPLIVYIILAILRRAKSICPNESMDASNLVETASSLMTGLSPSDCRNLCREARLLRRSTAISIMNDVILGFETKKEELSYDKALEQYHHHQLVNNNIRMPNPNVTTSSAWMWPSSSSKKEKNESKRLSRKSTTFKEALKVTFGLGNENASRLLLKKVVRKQNEMTQNEQILQQNDKKQNLFEVDISSLENIKVLKKCVTIADNGPLAKLKGEELEHARKEMAKARHIFNGLRKGSVIKLSDWETTLSLGNEYFIFDALCAPSNSKLPRKVLLAHGRLIVLEENHTESAPEIVLRNSHMSQVERVVVNSTFPPTVDIIYRGWPQQDGSMSNSMDSVAFHEVADLYRFIEVLRYLQRTMSVE